MTGGDEALGCAEEVRFRILRKGRTVYETDNFNCSWGRVADDISTGSFTIPADQGCALPSTHAIADMVEFERNGNVEWSGYNTQPIDADGGYQVSASDLLYGFEHRIIRDGLNFPATTDLTDIAEAVINSANGADPIPVVPVYFPSGITGARLYPVSDYRLAWDALKNDLLNIGLDMTMVGNLLYTGPLEQRNMRPLKVTEQMIYGVPSTGEDGANYGNRIIAKGQNGLVAIYPLGPAVAPEPYPLWEVVIDGGDAADIGSLTALAKENYDLRSGLPSFVNLDGSVQFKPDMPYPLRALIPSRLADVQMALPTTNVNSLMRLQTVTYDLTSGVEKISGALAPIGSVPAGTVV